MADTKTTALPALGAAPAGTDLIPMVDDPSGTPATKKMTVDELFSYRPKIKLDATAAPDADDDSGDGYGVGSLWVDVTGDKAYVCLDATSTAAVWTETTQIVDVLRTWTTVQRALVTALTDGTVAVDMATGQHFTLLLEENSTFSAPSNLVAGQSGMFIITQDGTGSRTLAFNAAYKFVGGTAPEVTATAGAISSIPYYCDGSNVWLFPVLADIKVAA